MPTVKMADTKMANTKMAVLLTEVPLLLLEEGNF